MSAGSTRRTSQRSRRLRAGRHAPLAIVATAVIAAVPILLAARSPVAFTPRQDASADVKERAPHQPLAPLETLKNPIDLDLVRTWVQAALTHNPGHGDAAAIAMAGWSSETLAVTLTDVSELSQAFAWLVAHDRAVCGAIPATDCKASGRVDYRGLKFRAGHGRSAVPLTNHIDVLPGPAAAQSSLEGLADLLALTPDDERAGSANRLLERGALLHTDVALLLSSSDFQAASLNRTAATGGSASLRVADGEVLDVESGADHWRNARFLLDAVDPDPARFAHVKWADVTPDPSADPFVRRWYKATSEAQVVEGRWSDAAPNLERGVMLFPDDPSLLLQSGAMHEAFGSPDLQAAAQAAVRAGLGQNVVNAPREWLEAKTFLEHAEAKAPDSAEIHLHLGHVLEESGQFEAAERELGLAAGHLGRADFEYDDTMFLGRAQAAAGDLAAAKASFEHAAALMPGVQSALIALSRVLQLSGDPDGAREPLMRALAKPGDGHPVADPLWDFDRSHVRDAEAHMAELERPFATGGSK